MSKDYYETLGVARTAGDDEIKKAYRKLAMEHHPDRNKGDKSAETKIKEINEAYETLKDPQKKAAYDRYGHNAYKNAASGGGGFNDRSEFYSDGFGFSSSSGFADIFEDFFSESSSMRSSRIDMRGSDLRYDVTITLEEAFHGKSLDLKVKTNLSCKDCRGSGSAKGEKPKACPSCRGSGRQRFTQGFFSVEKTCASCNGTGHIIENSCKSCRGAGRLAGTRNINVSIPAGIDDGARIRLSGEGEAGLRGGNAGDLYIFISIKPHQLFRRDGDGIHCDVPIPITTAALGGEVEVPTIDGKKAVVKIPAGTQSGSILKLRNKGMSVVRSSLRGDMHIHAKIETPVNLTKKQRELLMEFDREKENDPHPQSSGFFSKVKEFWKEL
ncbi:MAG: molecular chaperone DnaJ [Holosporaceae bacterium]|jgi:molecular chaperone DnaJ|nr:molecular chaperone DnaJ [Holosporaceae bacterium]